MSDKMRHRYGDTNPVVAAVDSETVIEIGDLVYQDWASGRAGYKVACPASYTPDEGSPELAQESFADDFLGVAMEASRSGETAPIGVATIGVFEFDCRSDTYELGDLVGVYVCTEVFLANQRVTKVTDSRFAIGRVARREAEAAGSVMVDIRSKVMGISL